MVTWKIDLLINWLCAKWLLAKRSRARWVLCLCFHWPISYTNVSLLGFLSVPFTSHPWLSYATSGLWCWVENTTSWCSWLLAMVCDWNVMLTISSYPNRDIWCWDSTPPLHSLLFSLSKYSRPKGLSSFSFKYLVFNTFLLSYSITARVIRKLENQQRNTNILTPYCEK